MTPEQLNEAHTHTINHRQEIEASSICGCFCCLKIFSPSLIWEWIVDGRGDEFCMCPNCDGEGYVDSIVPVSLV